MGGLAYDANNRLTEKGILLDKTSYDYDNNGNLTAKTQGSQTTRYRYDSQNRLVEVSDQDNNPIARYGYDPFDRRIWKEVYRNKDGAALSQPARGYYLYADEGLIAESRQAIVLNGGSSVTASAAPAITRQYGLRPDSPFGTGILFVKTKNSAGQATFAYYHHDHLGTPIQATDRSGIIVWSAQYNAFGRAVITTPTATDDKPVIDSSLRFPGQVEDAETGLYYNWHRYYDPEAGRYVTADPIGLAGGVNLYTYVGGNPTNLTDPKGLNAAAGAFEGGTIGAEVGTAILPGPGTIIGGAIGAGIGAGAGIILTSEISDILDEIMDELEKKKKAENEANCPSDNDENRCQKVLQSCRAQCTDTFVDDPNKLPGSGSDMFGRIRRCIRECMVNNGCNNF